MDRDSEARLAIKRDFAAFLDAEGAGGGGASAAGAGGLYAAKIGALLSVPGGVPARGARLDVDLQDLAGVAPDLHARLMDDPADCIPAFEEALDEIARSHHPKALSANPGARLRLGFSGHFGAARVSPRDLSSALLGRLVAVEGIVTKASLVRPKLARSVHYCEATGETISREYRDAASLGGGASGALGATGAAYPVTDDAGNLLSTEFGLCTYTDCQTLTVQELPESAPAGQLPRSVDVVLEHDLCDAAKPGDRVSVSGVYRAAPPRASGVMSGVFHAVLLGASVRKLSGGPGGTGSAGGDGAVTADDIENIEALAAQPDVLRQLAASLAPSIYGHDLVKLGLVLQLLGGRERELAESGTRLRGDVNVLMVGDPGVAKSQLLRAVMNVAPLAVSTTGRGSSGVGLTAAVTADRDTGEKRLEAGAMVLADRGVVCIDEFDKMADGDRVAIHEVMEQQTVTIAKAGIQTSLNARCSVLAAANPVYGSYDHGLSVARNVNLPDSLLSRFDLLFILLDNATAARDAAIAEHVLGQHRYRPPGDDGLGGVGGGGAGRGGDDEPGGPGATRLADESAADAAAARPDRGMRVQYDERLYGPRVPGTPLPLSTAFLKKYIAVVKRRCAAMPLTPDAMEAIGDFYAELRSSAADVRGGEAGGHSGGSGGGAVANALPVTVRTLETCIRLSTAAAKARLSAEGVTVQDVEVAKSLMTRMLDGDAAEAAAEEVVAAAEAGAGGRRGGGDESPPNNKGRRGGGRRSSSSSSSSSSSEDDDEQPGAAAAAPASTGRRPSKARAASARGTRAAGAAATTAAAGAPSTGRPTRGAKRLARDGEEEQMDVDASQQQLTEAQITAVAVAVRELLLERRGATSHSVDDVLARLSSTSSSSPSYSREAVSAALAELERRHADAPGSAGAVAPIMFEAATGRFYDAS